MSGRHGRVLFAFVALALRATPAVAQATGEAVNGLTVSLATDEAVWPLGTAKAFDATLTNVGQSPFLVDLFGGLHEVYQGKRGAGFVPSCWALVWDLSYHLVPPAPRRGAYTLCWDQFRRLGPAESHAVRLSLVLSDMAPGTYRVRLTYMPRLASPSFSLPDRWEEQHGLSEPMWVGMALSNEVVVAVAPAAKRPDAEAP